MSRVPWAGRPFQPELSATLTVSAAGAPFERETLQCHGNMAGWLNLATIEIWGQKIHFGDRLACGRMFI